MMLGLRHRQALTNMRNTAFLVGLAGLTSASPLAVRQTSYPQKSTSSGFTLVVNVTNPAADFCESINHYTLSSIHVGAGQALAAISTGSARVWYVNGTQQEISESKGTVVTDGGTPPFPNGIDIAEAEDSVSAVRVDAGDGTKGVQLTSGSEPYAYLTAPVIGSYIVCNESVPYYQGRKFLLLKHAETEINEEGESESNIPEDCVAIRLVPQCAKLADLPAGAIASHQPAIDGSAKRTIRFPLPMSQGLLVVGGAIFGGTLVAINAVFNREMREDGGMPPFEREYLNSTFLHTGLGVGIIALTARQMINTGFVYRLMVTNPWVVGIGGLALSFATMIGTRSISPDNYIPKYALWTAFNATQAAFVAPLLAFVPGALIARAGLYTVAMMGSISIVGATAKQEKYLYIGGPLLAGAAIVAASGLAPLVIPATAVRTLAFTENLWLYGGLAVFGGFTLYDVQKVLYHARLAEAGAIKKDPVNESISLELDFLNIFIRMVQILMMQQNRRK
ncbi:hypothetical protein BN1708_005954, partial [Verticillium longisporum]